MMKGMRKLKRESVGRRVGKVKFNPLFIFFTGECMEGPGAVLQTGKR